jgi:hypothetical protein
MDRRSATNAGVLAVGSFSLIGWLIPSLFRWIGWVEWAQGLGAVFSLFSDPRVSWSGIYILVFLGALSIGLVNNWNTFRNWRERRRRAQKRTWNLAAVDFVNWIAETSNTRRSFTKPYADAFDMFDANVRHDRLSIAGRAPGSGLLVQIKPTQLKQAKLRFTFHGPRGLDSAQFFDLWYSTEEDRENKLFTGLMVDYENAHKAIP